ncbi:MAG: DUF2141 domain-containing protein [Boseongicola sp.]
MKRAFIVSTVFAFALLANTSAAADLNLSITGVGSQSGQFLISVFTDGTSWMKRPISTGIAKVESGGSASVQFELPPGTYGLAVVHDANGDGKINVNALGIPTEAFGFSKNARSLFGPPRFNRARFELGENSKSITIRLNRAN